MYSQFYRTITMYFSIKIKEKRRSLQSRDSNLGVPNKLDHKYVTPRRLEILDQVHIMKIQGCCRKQHSAPSPQSIHYQLKELLTFIKVLHKIRNLISRYLIKNTEHQLGNLNSQL